MEFIARDGKRYTQVSPGTIYEASVQNLVFKNIDALFPEYFGILAEPFFETPAGNVQPDLVLIRHDFTGWALVEVEVEGHSWSGHILPQLSKLAAARASDTDDRKLADKFKRPAQIADIQIAFNTKPHVILAIHGSAEAARDKVHRLGVEVVNIDVFHAPPNDYLLAASPEEKWIEVNIGLLERHSNPILGGLWIFKGLDLGQILQSDGSLLVDFDGTVGFWQVSLASDGYLLRAPSDLTFSPEKSVVSIMFRKISKILRIRTR